MKMHKVGKFVLELSAATSSVIDLALANHSIPYADPIIAFNTTMLLLREHKEQYSIAIHTHLLKAVNCTISSAITTIIFTTTTATTVKGHLSIVHPSNTFPCPPPIHLTPLLIKKRQQPWLC